MTIAAAFVDAVVAMFDGDAPPKRIAVELDVHVSRVKRALARGGRVAKRWRKMQVVEAVAGGAETSQALGRALGLSPKVAGVHLCQGVDMGLLERAGYVHEPGARVALTRYRVRPGAEIRA